MQANRLARINEEILRALSDLIRNVKDPRVSGQLISITRVDATSDLSLARVYVSPFGSDSDTKDLMKGLKSASGYLRRELGRRVELRQTPEIQFHLDESITLGAHVLDVMDKVKKEEETH